jgi:predicted HicB family RNase H-like nuclease
MKQIYSFKFDPELLKELQREAKKENRSFNNYVETLLLSHPDRTLKKVKIVNPK